MESYFPDEYFYRKTAALSIPADNPGVLSIDRAITGAGKIFDEEGEALDNQESKRKIFFNLPIEAWKDDVFLSHAVLLLFSGFELYLISHAGIQQVTEIGYDFFDKVVSQSCGSDPVPTALIESIFSRDKIEENETLIFDKWHYLGLQNTVFSSKIGSLDVSKGTKLTIDYDYDSIGSYSKETIIPSINAASKLQFLNLRDFWNFKDFENPFIQNNTLHTLILESTRMKGSQLSQLLAPTLVILRMHKSHVSGACGEVKALPHLTHFKVTETYLSKDFLRELFTMFTALKELFLDAEYTNIEESTITSGPILLPKNPLRKIIVNDEFLKHFKIDTDAFLYLEHIILKTIASDFRFKTDVIKVLSTWIDQFKKKNICIEGTYPTLDPSKTGTFTARKSNPTQKYDFSFKEMEQSDVQYFLDNHLSDIGMLALNNIGFSSFLDKKSEFLNRLFATEIPICLGDIYNFLVTVSHLKQIDFDPSSRLNFDLQAEGKYHVFIQKNHWSISGRKSHPNESVKISTTTLALLFSKIPSSGVFLSLYDLEIIGDFRILPLKNAINDFFIRRVTLNGAYVEHFWASMHPYSLTVERFKVIENKPEFHTVHCEKLEIDQSSWNDYFSKCHFSEPLALEVIDCPTDASEKLSLALNKNVTEIDLDKVVLSEKDFNQLLLGFPNLKRLQIKEIKRGQEINHFVHNKLENLRIDFVSDYCLSFYFYQLKQLSLWNVETVDIKNILVLIFNSKNLREINLYGKDRKQIVFGAEDCFRDFITVIAQNLNDIDWLSDCKIYFRSPCRFIGDSEEVRSLVSHPNFEFLSDSGDHVVSRDMELLQRLSDFSPDAYRRLATNLDPNYTQMMLIHRLCVYAELILGKEKGEDFIRNKNLYKGICKVLSKLCGDTVYSGKIDDWNTKWRVIQQWDEITLPEKNTPTRNALQELFEYVDTYQYAHSLGELLIEYAYFELKGSAIITNDLVLLLKKNTLEGPIFLHNTWHTTCLFIKNDKYWYFEPGYKYGAPVSFESIEAISAEVHRTLGYGLLATSEYQILSDAWNSEPLLIEKFCIQGGFRFIPLYDPDLKNMNVLELSETAASAIFQISTYGKPFWFHGLSFTLFDGLYLSPFAKITLMFLERYLTLTDMSALNEKLAEGLKYLTDADKRTLVDALKYATTKSTNDVIEETFSSVFYGTPVSEPTGDKIISIILSNLYNFDSAKEAKYQWLEKVSPEEAKVPEAISLSALLEEEKLESSDISKKPVKALTQKALVHESHEISLMRDLFASWNQKNTSSKTYENLDQFDGDLLRLEGQNLVLDMSGDKKLVDYIHHLQATPLAKKRGLLVIQHPSAMQCATKSITLNEGLKGVIQPAPSGLFYDFLKSHDAPVIVIHWTAFATVAKEQANAMIENLRCIEGVRFPKNALILVLQNSKKIPAHLSSDFLNEIFPDHLEVMPITLPKVQLDEAESVKEVEIDLYGDNLWENFFYGHWELKPEGLFFKLSKLLKALDENPNALRIIIKNPPETPEFFYVLNSFLSKGTLEKYSLCFNLPKKISIEIEHGYTLAPLLEGNRLQVTEGCLAQSDEYILNPGNLSSFFVNYMIDPQTSSPITLPGFLKLSKGTEISVAVTRNISLAAWVRILKKANKENVILQVKLCKGVSLPPVLAELIYTKPVKILQPATVSAALPITHLIISDDVSATKKHLERERSIDMIVDVSDLSKGDIFYALYPAENISNEQLLKLNEVVSDILRLLNQESKTVLLTGSFSQEQVDALGVFFKPGGGIYHNGQWEYPSGKLILLTNQNNFTYVSNPEYRIETFEMKLELLSKGDRERLLHKYPQHVLEKYCFSYLQSLASCEMLPDDPKTLMDPYLISSSTEIDDNFSLKYERYIAFKESRESLFFNPFKKTCQLFIAGETGVGKSSFMHELAKRSDIKVFFGDIDEWVQSSLEKNDHIKYFILAFDEANTKNLNYASVKDLLNYLHNYFHKGRNYILDERFIVAFLGNPKNKNYGWRNLATLFIEYPNAITFGEMNNPYLYYEALHNILQDEAKPKSIAKIFLRTYQYIKSIDTQAITPRELQMMAYFFKAQKLSQEIPDAKHCSYQIARQLLREPKVQQAFDQWFQATFENLCFEKTLLPESIGCPIERSLKKEMLLVPELKDLYRLFRAFILVGEVKRQAQKGKASYGGLSGFILKNLKNGIGSMRYFVKQTLFEHGFIMKEVDADVLSPFDYEKAKSSYKLSDSKYFYVISSNLNLIAMKNLLTRAFHEGNTVVMNSVNSPQFRQLEQLMNALLMGEDLAGRRALVPGFSFIGLDTAAESQEELSLAFRRRAITVDCPSVTQESLNQIFVHKGCPEQPAKVFASEFWSYSKRAEENPNTHRKMPLKYAVQFIQSQGFFNRPLPQNETEVHQLAPPVQDFI